MVRTVFAWTPLAAAAALLVAAALPAQGQIVSGDRIAGHNHAGRSPVLAVNGMAATSHPLATKIAEDILKAGGNAEDAAIAANAFLGFAEPGMNGVGGDLFAIVWDADSERLHGLNASGRAPQGLTREQLVEALGDKPFIPMHGPLSVSTPGAVDGWFALHERFGRLPMEDILAPSIAYAEAGVPVPQTIAAQWQEAVERLTANEAEIGGLQNFLDTFTFDGRAPREGEVFRNPDLAETYRLIAEGGRDAFYEGAIAEAIDAYADRVGMHLRAADLAAHESTWVDPVSVNYRGYDVYQLPPNGQGAAALQMLNILEGYDLAAMGHNSADYLHVHAEAKKLAFADRARHYADPEFHDIPLERLLSKEYAAERRALIDMDRAQDAVDAGAPALAASDTVYLTVADSEGNMVSLIQSIFLNMGSGMVPDGLGFPLQCRGAGFSLEEGHPNVYEPGKRPFHTIIPGFVMKDGEPFMSFGVMGGPVQPQGHVQVLCNIIDFGMNLQEAGDAARYAHSGSSQPTGQVMTDGGTLALESRVPEATRADLRRRGHAISSDDFFGGYQAIKRDRENGVYVGASELRHDGLALGY